MSHAVEKIVVFFETLAPESVQRFSQFYTEDAYFKDPFNEVRGIAPIQSIFAHMYTALHEPRFVVTGRIVEGDQVFLSWDFHFRFRNFKSTQPQIIRGATHLRLAADGRIRSHRDYWDAAEELYEKLPLVGGLMRWLKKRANS
ncbi:MAG: nuclear transport factor 2 family protein [Burkholderiaceae bacterium]|jgi:ketosteroid isomerase-like protein|nr:nuclear transport factor 2 family protein [Burkholderiaceae bacterium]